jgi:hypothetical protein
MHAVLHLLVAEIAALGAVAAAADEAEYAEEEEEEDDDSTSSSSSLHWMQGSRTRHV